MREEKECPKMYFFLKIEKKSGKILQKT